MLHVLEFLLAATRSRKLTSGRFCFIRIISAVDMANNQKKEEEKKPFDGDVKAGQGKAKDG